ncbi:DUF6578 domain-containing protein [Streptomyces thermoalcalitolerans]|uniref:Uncharacterized protein n=1 Tax=Streptomyces thermoalcalitolerans TaxID=65605 RepID=A0ABN1NF46_9ACTN
MAVRWVFYENWQMECCGTPFSVGEKVSRPVRPVDPEDVLGEGCDKDSKRNDSKRNDSKKNDSKKNEESKEKYDGMLLVEQHGDAESEITGRVRAIRLVHRMYEETEPGSRTFAPTPDEASLEAVDSCPEWFSREELPTGPGSRRHRSTTGVLVALDVPDAAPVAFPGRL